MKYCANCKTLAAGQPLFCPNCNHTYDVKLCGSRHVNPRSAQFCQECGSNDLSTPQPARSWLITGLIHVAPKFVAFVLLLISIRVCLGLIVLVFTNQQLSQQAVAAVLILALAWFLYLKVAASLSAVRHLLGRSKKGSSGGRGHGGHGH